jgi:hypothetical protein
MGSSIGKKGNLKIRKRHMDEATTHTRRALFAAVIQVLILYATTSTPLCNHIESVNGTF